MTLTKARKILEEYLAWCRSYDDEPEPPQPSSDDLYDALEAAISVLPMESMRPTAARRLETIREYIRAAKDGFDPFGSPTRDKRHVCWRQCVWHLLQTEGYGNSEIAHASGFDHATVWWGTQRLQGYLASGDWLAVAVWEELNRILNGKE